MVKRIRRSVINNFTFKRFIVRTNAWYESLKEPMSSLFYIGLIFVPFILFAFHGMISYALLWAFLVGLWRFLYKIL